jgi:hypothetical protein
MGEKSADVVSARGENPPIALRLLVPIGATIGGQRYHRHTRGYGGETMKTIMLACAALCIATTAHAQVGGVDFRNGTNSPRIYSPQGEYLGNLNNNQFDPNSVSNQFGAGSPFKPNGVNNPFGPNYIPGLAPRR